MLFFLFVLGIIIINLVILVILILSTLKIEIINLRIGNIKIEKDYNIKISIKMFNKIKIFSTNLNKEKIKKLSNTKQFKSIDIKRIKNKVFLDKKDIKLLKKIIPKVEKLKLYIDLGTEDAVLTSYLIAIIASSIGIILPYTCKNINNCNYIVNPLYIGKNVFNLELESIISLKIVHIIYVIYILMMKGRDENERTSNRRAYDYSYGQY